MSKERQGVIRPREEVLAISGYLLSPSIERVIHHNKMVPLGDTHLKSVSRDRDTP